MRLTGVRREEGGNLMHKRGTARGCVCAASARLVLSILFALLLSTWIHIPAHAQNAAEAQPAKASPGQTKPEQTPASGPEQPATGPEKPATGPAQPANGAEQPAAGAEQSPPEQSAPDSETPKQPAGGWEPTNNAEGNTAGAAPEPPPEVAPPVGAEPAGTGEGAAAAEPVTGAGEAAGNAAEAGRAPTGSAAAEEDAPAGNQAEGRGAGTGDANRAEGGPPPVDAEGIAEPPGALFEAYTPGQLAGSIADYTAPSIDLSVTPLDQIPARPDPDSFYQPSRDYLERRPLPALNVDETDEERIARSIEESLALIDLSQEQRPAEGVQIPLPSGVVTFKASDAFQFDRPNRILKFTGNAEILFQDIAIWADYIEVNDGAATAYAKGYVAVQNQDEILYCDEAYLNYDTQNLELFWVEGNTGGPRLQGVLYFEADRAWGSFDHLIMEKVKITTCDPFCGGNEEYQIKARKAIYKRERSIVLNDVFLQVQGTKVGYVPLLAFPLMKDRQFIQDESAIQQNYGYNRSEGYFAKFAYTYSVRYAENVRNRLLGVMKLDLTQKKGPGVGLRQDFYIPSLGVTTITGYYQREWEWARDTLEDGTLADPEVNLEAELTQELNFSRELTGNLSVNRTDRYIPSYSQLTSGRRNNSWDSRLNLKYNSGNTDATLSATHRETVTGGTTRSDGTQEPERISTNLSGNFQLTERFSKETTFTLSESYTANKGGTTGQNLPADQEGTFEMRLDWRGGANTDARGWAIRSRYLEQGIDFDRNNNTRDNNTTIRKELPSVEIEAPRDLFNDGAYVTQFKLSLDNLVTGRRRNPDTSFRMLATVGGGDRFQFSRSSSLDTRFTFNQYAYDDGNAQYVLSPSVSYVYDPYSWWRFDSRWNLTYQQGVREPPVTGDRRTYQQSIGYGLTMTNHRSWSWQLRTGYNFTNWQHNPITSTFNWDANRTFGLTHTLSYTPRTNTWSPSRLTGAWRSPYIDPDGYYNWLFSFTLENNLDHEFRTTTFNTRWYKRFKRGWSAEVVGGYRDSQDEPIDLSWEFVKDYIQQIKVRKVNCCTTIEASWRTQYNEVLINVYLNALPQYPGTFWTRKPFDDEYEQQFLYPIDQTRNDILQDMFGISQSNQFTNLF